MKTVQKEKSNYKTTFQVDVRYIIGILRKKRHIILVKHAYGLKPDKLDVRDTIFKPKAESYVALPSKVDLRDKMSPVVDQGQLGSCTANSLASGLMEYLEKLQLKPGQLFTPLSRLFLYWHERELEGTVDEDSGAQLRDGMKVLKSIGVCPEADFPYDITKFTDTPSAQAEKDAGAHKIGQYHRIADLHSLKVALAQGHPVAIGMIVFESFESDDVAKTGLVPMPQHDEQELGGHALCCVGFDDTMDERDEEGYLIVRNSWGVSWGDKGYCYIPYDFVRYGIITDMWKGY